MTLRLDKFLSTRTELTRSEIKKLAAKKLIAVNGETVRDTSLKIDPENTEVTVSGKVIDADEMVYYIMNKPKGYISATEDKREKTVLELLSDEDRRKDIFPAGRLDKDTTGMLLLTNDGKLSHSILSPSKHIPKYYIVKLAKSFKAEYIKKINNGLTLHDGNKCLPASVRPFENAENTAFIELCEGKFHQIKRMFETLDNNVTELRRIQMGNLCIPPKLGLGEYVSIMHKDINKLFVKPDFDVVFGKIEKNFSSYWINI